MIMTSWELNLLRHISTEMINQLFCSGFLMMMLDCFRSEPPTQASCVGIIATLNRIIYWRWMPPIAWEKKHPMITHNFLNVWLSTPLGSELCKFMLTQIICSTFMESYWESGIHIIYGKDCALFKLIDLCGLYLKIEVSLSPIRIGVQILIRWGEVIQIVDYIYLIKYT